MLIQSGHVMIFVGLDTAGPAAARRFDSFKDMCAATARMSRWGVEPCRWPFDLASLVAWMSRRSLASSSHFCRGTGLRASASPCARGLLLTPEEQMTPPSSRVPIFAEERPALTPKAQKDSTCSMPIRSSRVPRACLRARKAAEWQYFGRMGPRRRQALDAETIDEAISWLHRRSAWRFCRSMLIAHWRSCQGLAGRGSRFPAGDLRASAPKRRMSRSINFLKQWCCRPSEPCSPAPFCPISSTKRTSEPTVKRSNACQERCCDGNRLAAVGGSMNP